MNSLQNKKYSDRKEKSMQDVINIRDWSIVLCLVTLIFWCLYKLISDNVLKKQSKVRILEEDAKEKSNRV